MPTSAVAHHYLCYTTQPSVLFYCEQGLFLRRDSVFHRRVWQRRHRRRRRVAQDRRPVPRPETSGHFWPLALGQFSAPIPNMARHAHGTSCLILSKILFFWITQNEYLPQRSSRYILLYWLTRMDSRPPSCKFLLTHVCSLF